MPYYHSQAEDAHLSVAAGSLEAMIELMGRSLEALRQLHAAGVTFAADDGLRQLLVSDEDLLRELMADHDDGGLLEEEDDWLDALADRLTDEDEDDDLDDDEDEWDR